VNLYAKTKRPKKKKGDKGRRKGKGKHGITVVAASKTRKWQGEAPDPIRGKSRHANKPPGSRTSHRLWEDHVKSMT